MAPRPGYDRLKLEELAQALNIRPVQPLKKLRSLTENDVPNFITSADEQRAEKCLLEGKSLKLIRKPTFRTKTRLEAYEAQNIAAALPALVAANEGAGVIQALLSREQRLASVKDNNKRQAQLEDRDTLLQRAVEASNADVVWILAPRTSLLRKSEALSIALAKRDSTIIQRLLENSADPNHCSQQFITAASSGDAFLIEHLLSAPLALHQGVLVEALKVAVQSASVHIVQRIVHAADLHGLQVVEAINEAANNGHVDALITVLLSASWIPPDHLDQLVLRVFNNIDVDTTSLKTILTALFLAGATGSDSSAAMRIAVERQSIEFVRLFAQYKVDINWGSGRIVHTAVQTGRCDLLHEVLLSGALSNDNASGAVKALPRNLPPQTRLEMLKVLIDVGAYGEPIEQELILAVQNNDQDLVALLRGRGVSIDNRAGDALIAAIQSDNVKLLGQLLDGPVAQTSLQNALPYVRSTNKISRLLMTTLLVKAKVEGENVDIALRDAICEHGPNRDRNLVELLLQANGDPAYGDAQCLRHTIQQNDAALFERLLVCPAGLSVGVLSSLLPQVIALHERGARFHMVRCILAARPRGEAINLALLDVVSEKTVDSHLLKLIVRSGQADINYQQGKILGKGALHDNTEVLQELMTMSNRSRSTTTAALVKLLVQRNWQDEVKAVRAGILMSSGRTSGAATQGLLYYVEFWKKSGVAGKDWPLQTFNILLAAGADVNSSADILLNATRAAAIPLLKVLLTHHPSSSILDSALLEAVALKLEARVDAVQQILEAGPTNTGISVATTYASRGDLDQICSLLLAHNPSLQHDGFASVRSAVASCRLSLINIFLESKPDQDVVEAAFEEAKSINNASLKYQVMKAILTAGVNQDLLSAYLVDTVSHDTQESMVRLLLDHQADVHHNQNQSLVLTAVENKLTILQMMFSKATNKRFVATQCFEACQEQNRVRLEHIPTLQFLMENGAHGHSLNLALQQTVYGLSACPDLLQLLKLLVSHGVDVNDDDGHALCHACETSGSEAVRILMQGRPSVTVKSRALRFLLKSKINDAEFCDTLDLLMRSEMSFDAIPSFYPTHEESEDPLRILLSMRPDGALELAHLLKYHSRILQQPTSHNILSWAMAKEAVRVHSECLALLITKGANVRYRDPQKGESVLLQAIRSDRGELVKLMVAHGADTSVADDEGTTPLALASELGDHQAAAILLEAGAPKNDGSLHIAAREVNPRVVETLLKYGHDPNHPSTQTQGRTPLAELLFNGEVNLQNHSTVERVICLLKQSGTNTEKHISRKPLICWAIDNKCSPVRMVQALLNAYLHGELDADFNLYKSGGFCYSPTMYVTKHQYAGFPRLADELSALLRNWGANRDVYYSLTGPQPDDAEGVPEDLARVESIRRMRLAIRKEEEEDLARRRRLEDEEIQRRRRIEEEEVERKRRREEEDIERQISYRRRLEAEDCRISRQKNDLSIALSMEAEESKQRQLRSRNALQLSLQQQLAESEQRYLMDRISAQEREREGELGHRTALSNLELETTRERFLLQSSNQQSAAVAAQSALEAQMKIQQQLMSRQDHHNERMHERRMKQLAMEKAMPVGWAPSGGGFIEN